MKPDKVLSFMFGLFTIVIILCFLIKVNSSLACLAPWGVYKVSFP